MNKIPTKIEYLAETLGQLFRVSQNNTTLLVHEWMCAVLTAATDAVCNNKQEREDFLALVDETEITGM